MKLLLDHNLPPRLVQLLANLHPNSQHVFLLGMDQANDQLCVFEESVFPINTLVCIDC